VIRRSRYVITDSGGLQREAVYLGRPVVLARAETEWHELEISGWLKVCGYAFDLSRLTSFPDAKSPELEHLMRPASKEIASILSGL
jgi:UDP-N-acetylglucosamine 2-epimerase